MINPTVMSTKSGGPIASAWATMYYLGQEGYLRIAEATLDGARRLLAGLDAIPELRVMGRPDANLMAVTSDEVDVFHVADEMRTRGWYVQPQLGYGRHRENLHFSVGPHNAIDVQMKLSQLCLLLSVLPR